MLLSRRNGAPLISAVFLNPFQSYHQDFEACAEEEKVFHENFDEPSDVVLLTAEMQFKYQVKQHSETTV